MSDPKASDDLKPIGLTVYDLPQQTSSSLSESSRTRGGRVYMLLVLLACAAPVLLSYLTYYVIRPEGRVHHGELIEPQRMLPAASAKDLQGKELPLAQLKGQWLLPATGRAVEEHLYLIDPMGNWMMRFNYPEDAKTVVDMKRDIERLLRASSSWDKPGR